MMASLQQSGSFAIGEKSLKEMRALFGSSRTGEAETAETIRMTLAETGELLDPHTAVGYAAAKLHARESEPMVTLATAHPAKFPDAVEKASGIRPGLPDRLSDLLQRPEKMEVLPNDLKTLQNYILARTGRAS